MGNGILVGSSLASLPEIIICKEKLEILYKILVIQKEN